MYAYIACDLFTNLETFSTLIDCQKKCYGKYTPKAVFVAGLYILSITPKFSRASYSRCSYFFLIDSSQCLLILSKQLSPSTIQWSYWQLIEFWRFVFIMKLYGFGRFRPKISFCTISINDLKNHNFINKSTRYFQNFIYFENIYTHVKLFHEK